MRRTYKKKKLNRSLQEVFEEFMKEKNSENLSEETVKTYTLHITHFLKTMKLSNLPAGKFDKSYYMDWIILLKKDSKKNDVTVASYCRSVRTFIYWMQSNDYVECFQVKIPKYQQKVKKCYTDNELTILLKKPLFDSPVEYRTWTLINLVCATGLRIRSVLNLHIRDIVVEESLLYVDVTKNHKGQILYLNENILDILIQYINVFELSEADYLFFNMHNKKIQIHRKTAQENLAAFNRKHGVDKTSVHLMRHTFAKNFYAHTHDIHTLSQLLGHSSISVTEIYLRDLGIAPERATAYNPQELYAK